jgi:hypothetical protein
LHHAPIPSLLVRTQMVHWRLPPYAVVKGNEGVTGPKLGEPATSKSHYAIMESIMQRLQTLDVQVRIWLPFSLMIQTELTIKIVLR